MLIVFVVPRYFLFPTKLASCVALQKHSSPLSQGLMFKSDLSVGIFEEPQHVCILVKTLSRWAFGGVENFTGRLWFQSLADSDIRHVYSIEG